MAVPAHGTDIHEDLRKLVRGIATGRTAVTIERVRPFADALSALATVSTGHARGKTVLRLAGTDAAPPL